MLITVLRDVLFLVFVLLSSCEAYACAKISAFDNLV